jgi:uncharacterized protein Smg (DUF494 family)
LEFDTASPGHCLDLAALLRGEVSEPEQRTMTFRVLGPHERGRFTPDAWGHLISMSGAGMLNAVELEHVIERALSQIDGRIALDDLRVLMEGAGYMDDGLGGENVTIH